ncbi:hypothetical protein Tco_0455094 [Tanacetum coccineum]
MNAGRYCSKGVMLADLDGDGKSDGRMRIAKGRGREYYSSETLFTSRNCPSREGMKGKSFEEGLAEITETLKLLQSTLLFHQTKLKESFRQARQDFALAHRDISLAD